MHYHLLPLLLLQGVKELKNENDRLSAENTGLRERLAALEQGVAALGSELGGGQVLTTQNGGQWEEESTTLKQENAAQQEISDLKARLQALEQRLGTEKGEPRQGAALLLGWLLLAGLGLALAFVAGRRAAAL